MDVTSYEKPGSTTIPAARMIPFDKFPKAKYRLEVQATDSAGRSTAWRTADFSATRDRQIQIPRFRSKST